MRMQGRGDYGKRDDYERQFHSGGGSSVLIGKPATAFTAGALSDPDNVVNLWQGPWVTGDASTGQTREAAWSTGDFATTDYVVLTRINGKWIVSCFPGGGA